MDTTRTTRPTTIDTSTHTASRPRRYVAGAALALSSVLVLGACGDDDDGVVDDDLENQVDDVTDEMGDLGEDLGDSIEDGTDDLGDDG